MIETIHRRGQALVLVTFALVAMIGIVGLAVDFSFAYFLEKTMQAAADSAALAAVQAAREAGGGSAGVNCTSAGGCYPAATSCSSIGSGTARAGCQYAAQNGFIASEVTLQSNVAAAMAADGACAPPVKHPPTAGCVSTLYYVTARISRRVPQLFSAILGRSEGGVSARATAGLAEVTFRGSLILTNRNSDIPVSGSDIPPNGSNLDVQGGGGVIVPGGIVLGSSSSTNPRQAGRIQSNSGSVVSPFTYARAVTNIIGGNAYTNWVCAAGGAFCPPTVQADGEIFRDPFDVKSVNGDISGQPPIWGAGQSPAGDTLRPVPGGILTNAICPSGNCPPGIYYATEPDCNGCPLSHPSGTQIRSSNNQTLNFTGGGSFGRYMFVGGLNLQNGSTVTMQPGRYVFAGVLNTADPVFQNSNSVNLTGGNGSDAGRIMIFTDFRTGAQRNSPGGSAADVDSYANQMDSIPNLIRTACGGCNWNLNPWGNTGLRHGSVDIKAGNNANSLINLEGLQETTPAGVATALPAELAPYGRVLMWQDQHNSYSWYKQNGQLDLACGGQNAPCANTPDSPTAPMLSVWASPNTSYKGAIYQPRGAWTKLQGSGVYSGPLQIITGAMTLSGTPQVTLTSTSDPISTFRTALVE